MCMSTGGSSRQAVSSSSRKGPIHQLAARRRIQEAPPPPDEGHSSSSPLSRVGRAVTLAPASKLPDAGSPHLGGAKPPLQRKGGGRRSSGPGGGVAVWQPGNHLPRRTARMRPRDGHAARSTPRGWLPWPPRQRRQDVEEGPQDRTLAWHGRGTVPGAGEGRCTA